MSPSHSNGNRAGPGYAPRDDILLEPNTLKCIFVGVKLFNAEVQAKHLAAMEFTIEIFGKRVA